MIYSFRALLRGFDNRERGWRGFSIENERTVWVHLGIIISYGDRTPAANMGWWTHLELRIWQSSAGHYIPLHFPSSTYSLIELYSLIEFISQFSLAVCWSLILSTTLSCIRYMSSSSKTKSKCISLQSIQNGTYIQIPLHLGDLLQIIYVYS